MRLPEDDLELRYFLDDLSNNFDDNIASDFEQLIQDIPLNVLLSEKRLACFIEHLLEVLEKYRQEIRYERESYDRIVANLKEKINQLQKQLYELERYKIESCNMVAFPQQKSEVKTYKNLHIYIFSHPSNHSLAAIELLSSINYLNAMTRDVSISMPGYHRAVDSEEVINPQEKKMPLTFDEDVFIRFIQDFEDETDGAFEYNNDCELVVIAQNQDGSFDKDSLVRINFDELERKRGIDLIKLILGISNKFRKDNSQTLDARKLVNEVLGELCISDDTPIFKVFIAGAKKLVNERRIIREQISRLANEHNIDIRSLTFEDFPVTLKGDQQGRQKDYNTFIRNEANVVIFIFDSIMGRITEEEFKVAYDSLTEDGHPDIFVYVKKQIFTLDKRLKSLKDKVFGATNEYYTEYKNLDNLTYLVFSNFNSYLNEKLSK